VGLVGRLPELDVSGDETAQALILGSLDVPARIEQRPDP